VPEHEDAEATRKEEETEAETLARNRDQRLLSARLGILEFLRVPSRFADAEQRIPPDDAVALSTRLVADGGRPLFLPPHNYLSHFREPGRVNLNTITSAEVWAALTGGQPPVPYDDEVHYDSDGTSITFEPSEDWLLADAESASQPVSGNWELDAGEDANENGRLDLNHDANNDGRQANSVITGTDFTVESIAAARRGWPVGGAAIAGQFDRMLNRAGCTSETQWFATPFRSGWSDLGGGVYGPHNSLLMRPSVQRHGTVRLSKGDAGSALLQHEPVSLKYDIIYTCRIEVAGGFTPGDEDRIPELSVGGIPYQPFSARKESDNKLVAYLRMPKSSAPSPVPLTVAATLKLELFSQDAIEIRGVSLMGPDGIELLPNGRFIQGLAGWDNKSGDVALIDPSPPPLPHYPLLTRRLEIEQPTSRAGRDYADPDRNPYFLYQDIVRLSNLATPRSNVFAVWTTVGFFELDGQNRLGSEYGLDTGNTVRHKSFQIIDRSIPVGYEPDNDFQGNSRDTLLYENFTN